MLTLATLPLEILRNITSFLTRWNDVEALCYTGNSLLTTKLQSGGVVSLVFDAPKFSRSAFRVLSTIHLDSGHVIAIEPCPDHQRMLIHRMTPFLRHLSIDMHTTCLRDVFQSSNLDLSSTSNKPLYNAFEPWIVSQHMPVLESLHITSSKSITYELSNEFNDSFWTAFIQGLPHSLTSLRMPYLHVHDWSILPPHITSLQGFCGTFPLSTFLPESLEDLSISSLLMKEDLERIQADSDYPANFALIDQLETANFGQFVTPANLTRLSIVCEEKTFMTLLQKELTPNLFTLKWKSPSRFREPRPFDLDSLLGSIPASVISLSMRSCYLASATLRSLPSTSKCPNVKKLIFDFYVDSDDQAFIALVHQKIMSSMSGVEYLGLADVSRTFDGVPPEDLVFLSRHLRTLEAALSSDCFTLSSNGSYNTLLLTQLESLTLQRVKTSPNFDFSFASIPPTVTLLRLGNLPIRSTEMLNLPSTIKLLFKMRVNAENGGQDLIHLLTPPGSQDPRSMYLSVSVTLKPISLPCLNASSLDSTVKPRHHWFSTDRAPTDDVFPIHWYPAEFPLLPSTLTCLKLHRSWANEILINSLTPAYLPHLEALEFVGNLLNGLKLVDFQRLTSLKFQHFEANHEDLFPSSLKNLECYHYSSKGPLPGSLTRLIADSFALDSNELESRNNLVEVGSLSSAPKVVTTLTQYAFRSAAVHPLITTFSIHAGFSRHNVFDLSTFSTRFPSLQHLHIRSFIDYEFLADLYDCLPAHTTLHGGYFKHLSLSDLQDLWTRYCASKSLPSTSRTLQECIKCACSSGFPRWKPEEVTVEHHFFFDETTWNGFSSLLSPSIHTFKLPKFTYLEDGVMTFPSSIASLIIGRTADYENTIFDFPISLKTLDLVTDFGNMIPTLPTHLTSLNLTFKQSSFTRLHASALPRSLTHLSITANGVDDDAFETLPSSIVWLKMDSEETSLTLPLLTSIASYVRLYEGNLDKTTHCSSHSGPWIYWHTSMGSYTGEGYPSFTSDIDYPCCC